MQFVFVRRDGYKAPFQRPYSGPYRVIRPGIKSFELLMKNRVDSVSIDRLKEAHLDSVSQEALKSLPIPVPKTVKTGNRPRLHPPSAEAEEPQQPPPAPYTTSRGRTVRPVVRFEAT